MRALKHVHLQVFQELCSNVTTQAREGIETLPDENLGRSGRVTTQAHEGIETLQCHAIAPSSNVTTQAHEGIEIVEHTFFSYSFTR